MTTTGPGSSGPSPDDGRETPIEPPEIPDQTPTPVGEDPETEIKEEPMTAEPEQNPRRSFREWPWGGILAGAAIVALLILLGQEIMDDSENNAAQESKETASATSAARAPMYLESYTIRVIDVEKVDYRKWTATVYAHEACSSKEIKEFAREGGVIESRIPIEPDGTIRVRLISGNYAVGIGNGTDSYGHLLVDVGGDQDGRFAYDPVQGSCASDLRADRVIVFSELENLRVMLVPQSTPEATPEATQEPIATPEPTPVATAVPTPAPPRATATPAPTAAPKPGFTFVATASPNSGMAPLTSVITASVKSTTNVKREVWLVWVDCENNNTWEYASSQMVGRTKQFSCTYSSAGTYTVNVRLVLDEDRSVVKSSWAAVTVTNPSTPTPTSTPSAALPPGVFLDVLPLQLSGTSPFTSTIAATIQGVSNLPGGWTATYTFDCDNNGVDYQGPNASHACTFSGAGTHVVTATVVIRTVAGVNLEPLRGEASVEVQ